MSGEDHPELVDAAKTLSDLAEIINHLWGVATPGGRIYSARIRREVVVSAWNNAGTQFQTALAEGLFETLEPDDQQWQCVILRAVFRPGQRIDPGLHELDSRYEVTLPRRIALGSDSFTDAAPPGTPSTDLRPTSATTSTGHSFSATAAPTCSCRCGPQWPLPLPDADRYGCWYAIRADHPNDAYRHIRNLVALRPGQCLRRFGCPRFRDLLPPSASPRVHTAPTTMPLRVVRTRICP